MPIQYVGGVSSSRNGNSNATTTQSLTALTGGIASAPADGDLVIVVCVVGSQGRNPAQAISGYTTLGTQLNPNTTTYDTSLQVSWKRMTSTPDTSITIPAQGNIADGQAWAVMVFRGVDATTPFDVTSVSATGTATGRFNAAAITPTTSGAWIVIAGGGAAATGAAYVAPTGFTTNWLSPAAGADTNDAMAAMGYYTGWTSGQYDPAVVTGGTTNAVDSWAAWTMALRPQAATTYNQQCYATGSGSVSFARAAVFAYASGAIAATGAATLSRLLVYSRLLTTTGTGSVTLGRAISKTFSVTGTGATTLARNIAKTFATTGTATVSATQTLVTTLVQQCYAVGSGTVTLAKNISKAFAATGTGAVTVAKGISKSFAVTGTGSASLTKLVRKTLSATGSGAASLLRLISKTFAVTGTGAASQNEAVVMTVQRSTTGTGTASSTQTFIAGNGLIAFLRKLHRATFGFLGRR